jgi:TonB family protein
MPIVIEVLPMLRNAMTHCVRTALVVLGAALLHGCGTTYRTEYVNRIGAGQQLAAKCGPSPQIPRSVYSDPTFTFASLTVQFLLLPSSQAIDVEIVRSSGYPELDASVIRTVAAWRCPYPGGATTPQTVVMPLSFGMEGRKGPATTAEVLWFGTYSGTTAHTVDDLASWTGKTTVVSGGTLRERTHRIAPALGTSFGVAYKFAGPVPDQWIRHRVTWRFPEPGLADPKSALPVRLVEREALCQMGRQCVAGFRFDAGWEMRDGTWVLEIWHDSELVVNESFEVHSN